MGNFLSTFTANYIGDESVVSTKLSAHNVLFDLPFDLIQSIITEWLRCPKEVNRDLVMIDSAICNKEFRPLLFQIYKESNFDRLFGGEDDPRDQLRLGQKMKWSIIREIKITELVLGELWNSDLSKLFFKTTGQTIKALWAVNNASLGPICTQLIAKYCTQLEILCIENCSLCVAVAKIASKCPLKELRLKNHVRWGMPVKNNLLRRIVCPTLRKLALLNCIKLKHTDAIVNAFPNVNDLEIQYPNRTSEDSEILTKLLTSYHTLHTLRLYRVYEPTQGAFNAIVKHSPHLRNVCFNESVLCYNGYIPEEDCVDILVNFVQQCTSLASLTIHETDYGGLRPSTQVRIIAAMNSRLEEFCMGTMVYDYSVLQALIQYAPNLVKLELAGFYKYGYSSSIMVDVYEACPLLTELHYSIANITNAKYDEVIPEIADIGKYCKNMQNLLLQDSHHMELKDVQYLIQHCLQLKAIATNSKTLRKQLCGVCCGVKILHCKPVEVRKWLRLE